MDNPQPSSEKEKVHWLYGMGSLWGLRFSRAHRETGAVGRIRTPEMAFLRDQQEPVGLDHFQKLFCRRTCRRIIIAIIHLDWFRPVWKHKTNKQNRKFSTVDISVPTSRKNAANCDTQCELQDPRVIRSLNALSANVKFSFACVSQCWIYYSKCGWTLFFREKGAICDWSREVVTASAAISRVPVERSQSSKALKITKTWDRQDYPLNLSISVSGGKEINWDCLSRGDWTGNSPALKSPALGRRIVICRNVFVIDTGITSMEREIKEG